MWSSSLSTNGEPVHSQCIVELPPKNIFTSRSYNNSIKSLSREFWILLIHQSIDHSGMSDSADVFRGAILTSVLSKIKGKLISVYSGEVRIRCILKKLAEQKCIKKVYNKGFIQQKLGIRQVILNKISTFKIAWTWTQNLDKTLQHLERNPYDISAKELVTS